jgi:hypothetical protein
MNQIYSKRIWDPIYFLDLQADWATAERLYPQCSIMWDINGGPDWMANLDPVIILQPDLFLCIGAGTDFPYRWAYWDLRKKKWEFILATEDSLVPIASS